MMPWRWHTRCRIPLVWRMRGVVRPWSTSFAGTCQPCTSTQRLPSRSRPSRAFHSGWPRNELAWVGAGHAGPGRGGVGPDTSGDRRLSGHRGSAVVPSLYTLLAEVCDHLGHTENGLQALAEAYALVEQHEERWWEAEVCRLRGVLLLRQPGTPQAEAETWLHQALDIARRQEAKSLELRAAMSLVGCGSSRASARKRRSCWRRSMGGSRRALTPPISRKRRRYWRSWGHKQACAPSAAATVGPTASQRGATARGGQPRHAASRSTDRGAWVLRGGMDGGTQYPWHNRP